MIKVKRCKGGFGITDGKKWFAYIYPTEDAAKAAMVKAGGFEDRMVRYVNISYPEAFMPARGVWSLTMKTKDVVIGHTYLTYIGAELCKVEVVGIRPRPESRIVFNVRRVGDWKILPKARSATALRACASNAFDEKETGIPVCELAGCPCQE